MAPFTGEPTESQQVALALVPKFTAGLSMVGSCIIIADVFRRRKQNKRATYHRLLFGMSICDFVMSFGIFLSTWTMPKGTPYVWGAQGNTQTCTFQGFLEQISVAAVMYNASLGIYYLVTIRNSWAKPRVHRLEPWLHSVPLVFGISTMIAGLFLHLYNYGIWDCWIAPYPNDCKESWLNGGETNCERGDNASLYQWLFDLIPKWASIILVTICMILVFRSVRRTERAQNRYEFEGTGQQILKRSTISDSAIRSTKNLSVTFASSSIVLSTPAPQKKKKSCSNMVAQQAYLYVGALYITWIPVVILRLTQLIAGVTHYEMILTVAITIPLQGFWNCCVYLRPRYAKLRQEQKEARRAAAVRLLPNLSVVEAVEVMSFQTVDAFRAITNAVKQGDVDLEDEESSGNDAGIYLKDEEQATPVFAHIEEERVERNFEDPLASCVAVLETAPR